MIRRTFIPGSEWLYFKIYTGFKTADELLIRVIGPLLKVLFAEQSIDGFFFIRYSDPEFHIRFRLHIPCPEKIGDIMREFYRRFVVEIETGNVSRIMCDTYVREIERYGTKSIELLEDLFRMDSMAILDLLSRSTDIPSDHRESVRWKLSLLLLDDTLSAFGYGLKEKARITATMAESFKKEFGFTMHTFTKQLNDKYRTLRAEIEQVLVARKDLPDYEDILKIRRNGFGQIARQIASLPKSEGNVTVDELLQSIQHMTMNRWFRSKNRLHEMVLYDFQRRNYESALARK